MTGTRLVEPIRQFRGHLKGRLVTVAIHSREILDDLHAAEHGVAKFNRRLGVTITNAVATMWCAYVFAVIALISLPAAIQASFLSGGFRPLPIVTWVAQTFLQLVLLAVILFGQNLESEKADARAEATFRNTKAAEKWLGEILDGIAKRGEENARMEAQNNEILKRLEARGPGGAPRGTSGGASPSTLGPPPGGAAGQPV